MPYELQLERTPCGFTLEAAKGGGNVRVRCAGIATSEDGEQLIRFLGCAGELLDKLEKVGHEFERSKIDNFLAIIRRDRTASVYVNELRLSTQMRIARRCEAGDPVFLDDVIDISESRLGDVEIPDDAGVVVVISLGWRKAVLFDFCCLGTGNPTARHYDLWPTLGQLVARLMYQNRFSICDDDWKKLFACRWFPFVGLSNASIEKMLGHVRADWGADDLLPELRTELLMKIDGFLDAWRRKEQFRGHVPLLDRAVERFKADDYVSCTAIVFPRIEGLLRAHHALETPTVPRTQSTLSAGAVTAVASNPFSLLLPLRFQEYLKRVFFANFDEGQQVIPVGRNSVGHGVASADNYNLETAMLGLLICQQLFYSFPPDKALDAPLGCAPVSS